MSKKDTPVKLTAAMETLAATAIHAFAKDSETAAKSTDNMSKHVLKLAVEAQKHTDVEGIFVALCRHAETVFKQENMADGKEKPIKALLPFWPVVKSQVRAGLKVGVKMDKVKSVYEMQKSLPKAERKPGGATNAKLTLPKNLNDSMAALTQALKTIITTRPGLVDGANAIIVRAAEDLGTLIKGDEKSEAIEPSNAGGVPTEKAA
jgi:hypothetical protein